MGLSPVALVQKVAGGARNAVARLAGDDVPPAPRGATASAAGGSASFADALRGAVAERGSSQPVWAVGIHRKGSRVHALRRPVVEAPATIASPPGKTRPVAAPAAAVSAAPPPPAVVPPVSRGAVPVPAGPVATAAPVGLAEAEAAAPVHGSTEVVPRDPKTGEPRPTLQDLMRDLGIEPLPEQR